MEYVQLTLDDWVKMKEGIRKELQNVKQSFVRIGYALRQIEEGKYYEQDGYKSVAEFARSEYGLEPSTTSRFMAINKEYSIDGFSDRLSPEYAEYGRSQLEEMLKLPAEDRKMITPETPRETIRELKRFEKEGKAAGDEGLQAVIQSFCLENPQLRTILDGELSAIIDDIAPSGTRTYRKGVYFLNITEDKIHIKKFAEQPQTMGWPKFVEAMKACSWPDPSAEAKKPEEDGEPSESAQTSEPEENLKKREENPQKPEERLEYPENEQNPQAEALEEQQESTQNQEQEEAQDKEPEMKKKLPEERKENKKKAAQEPTRQQEERHEKKDRSTGEKDPENPGNNVSDSLLEEEKKPGKETPANCAGAKNEGTMTRKEYLETLTVYGMAEYLNREYRRGCLGDVHLRNTDVMTAYLQTVVDGYGRETE